jgi:transaldolase
VDEGYAEAVIAEFIREGINDEALAARLQIEGTTAFIRSWRDLMGRIASKEAVTIGQ